MNEKADLVEVLRPPREPVDGGLDLVVGYDGSPESHAAVDYAERLFGDRIGRLTLVTVIPFDSGRADERDARSALLEEAAMLEPGLGLEVAFGPPATALQGVVHRDDYDLLVVGTSERGTMHLLGDAARELASRSTVPVLLVPPTTERADGHDHE